MSKNIDEIRYKSVIKKLQNLGLSEKEARVYIALLPTPHVGASKVMRATNLHGQFVYQALDQLEQFGLVKHVVQNGRKKFSANPPGRLLSLVEEKRTSAVMIAEELEASFVREQKQNFEILQGQSAFIDHEFDLLETVPQGSSIAVIGGGGDKYIQIMGLELNKYERRRAEKRVAIRYISAAGQDNYLKIMAQTRKFFDYRVLPGLKPGLVDTNIWPDRMVYHLYGDPIVSFSLINKGISESSQQFFEALWDLSSK